MRVYFYSHLATSVKFVEKKAAPATEIKNFMLWSYVRRPKMLVVFYIFKPIPSLLREIIAPFISGIVIYCPVRFICRRLVNGLHCLKLIFLNDTCSWCALEVSRYNALDL